MTDDIWAEAHELDDAYDADTKNDAARMARLALATKRGAETLGKIVEDQCRDILNVTGLHDWIDETGDGDWGAIWENAYELLPRIKNAHAGRQRAEAELERANARQERTWGLAQRRGQAVMNLRGDLAAAEARVEELERENAELRAVVAEVEALAEEWGQAGFDMEVAQLRAALSGAPAALAEVKAAAWDEGYARGVRDSAWDMEPADNPYRQDGAR